MCVWRRGPATWRHTQRCTGRPPPVEIALVTGPIEIATTAAAVVAASATGPLAWTSFVHPELPAPEHLTVERLDRLRGVIVGHLDEPEATWPPCLAVNGECARNDLPVSRKQLLHFLL